jgi:hypothetical protein
MQDRDLDALEALTLNDYISAGGPGARTPGRDVFLEDVRHSLSAA